MELARPLGILFADADLAATRPLRVELRRRGASVEMATAGQEAIQKAESRPPDLVVIGGSVIRDAGSDLALVFRASVPRAQFILLRSPGEEAPESPGSGILFSATKPVSKEQLLEVIGSAFPGRLGPPPAGPAAPRKVLCVDDDIPYLRSLSRFLRRRGYEVYAHESARRALQALREIRPELAVVDILMPDMDGLALTRRICQDYQGQVPVVVLTGAASPEAYQRARECGASYCLSKPYRPEDFLNVVDFIAGDLDEEERNLLRNRNLSASAS